MDFLGLRKHAEDQKNEWSEIKPKLKGLKQFWKDASNKSPSLREGWRQTAAEIKENWQKGPTLEEHLTKIINSRN
ncbi:hypothetical protein CWR48_13210 [Oceanobacillus arenosus]|uniref:Uncharacterized protein n=1 Tax=Oceanobacillus arenosus TaxID=1229153 RepID=A0A3D8PQF4_9BACI|nr:hypothetical protein [Oceanobacillus arenosus]RDW17478.1 hypothetical protein CWR48_13210 [Oceanobacillus arenosus]